MLLILSLACLALPVQAQGVRPDTLAYPEPPPRNETSVLRHKDTLILRGSFLLAGGLGLSTSAARRWAR